MDTKFQTSFIPKKSSLVEQKAIRHGRSGSILTFIAVLIFLVSVGGAVFATLWKNYMLKAQERYATALLDAEKKFDTNLIDELTKHSAKLSLTQEILENHLAVSEVFSILESMTVAGVKFNSFEFARDALNAATEIKLEGVGNSLSSVAYQSDVFGQSGRFGQNKVLKNPIVSDLQILERGDVGFTFTATIDPANLSYKNILNEELNPTQ